MSEFIIRIDGQVQEPSLFERTSHALANAAINTIQATYDASKAIFIDCANNLALDIADSKYGTNMRSEYINQKRIKQIGSIANKYGLVSRDTAGRYSIIN